MKVFTDVRALRTALHEADATRRGLGLVPTMGALHAGHGSLVRRARGENPLVAASIFVNPLQFGPGEDFEKYPRTEEEDLRLLEAEGCDFVLLGRKDDLYPEGFSSLVRCTAPFVSELEGAQRPGHFDGVATVVTKLFLVFAPTRAYFAYKDLQQLALVQQIVRDLGFPLEVVPCEIFRESDGLAMSSRNRYLEPALRAEAPRLYASLCSARALVRAKPRTRAELERHVRELLEPDFDVEYVDVRSIPGFVASPDPIADGRIVVTARLGPVRLLDNLELGESAP